jgi:hypothetical protein
VPTRSSARKAKPGRSNDRLGASGCPRRLRRRRARRRRGRAAPPGPEGRQAEPRLLLAAGARAASARLLPVGVHDHRRSRRGQAVQPDPLPDLLRRLADGLGQRRRPLALPSAWIETGKGQAKSPLMAGSASTRWAGATSNGRRSTRSRRTSRPPTSCSRTQRPCAGPRYPGYDDGESLEQLGHVVLRGELDNAWKIEHPATGSFFLPLAGGEQQSGPRPRMVLADEIHEFTTDGADPDLGSAIAKVAGSAMMVLGTNTPATSQIVGTPARRRRRRSPRAT